MELEINMSDKDIIDPDRSKTGRIFLLLIPSAFYLFIVFISLKSGIPSLELLLLLLWFGSILVMNYRFSGLYYKFATLYRKKLNPDFPLTRYEAYERDKKKGNFWGSMYISPNPVIFKHVDDPELAVMARKLKIMFFSMLLSPVALFILMIVASLLHNS